MSIPDPRLDPAHERRIEHAAGTLTLVGVVHGHPASIYRARSVVADWDPAVLALELPPLALPRFLAKARAGEDAGEMVAAIRGSGDSMIVGIDGPSTAFLRDLLRTFRKERPPAGVAARVLQASLTAALNGAKWRFGIGDIPTGDGTYRVSSTDPPEAQAKDERNHLAHARSVMSSFDVRETARLRDQSRETHMAKRLVGLSREGDVVAIVGRHHLDPLAERCERRLRDCTNKTAATGRPFRPLRRSRRGRVPL